MKKIKKSSKVVRRDRNPGEVLTRACAIRSVCLLCCGGNYSKVKNCQTKECHLYPYRLGMSSEKLLGGIDPEVYDEKEKYGDIFPNRIKYSYEKK